MQFSTKTQLPETFSSSESLFVQVSSDCEEQAGLCYKAFFMCRKGCVFWRHDRHHHDTNQHDIHAQYDNTFRAIGFFFFLRLMTRVTTDKKSSIVLIYLKKDTNIYTE